MTMSEFVHYHFIIKGHSVPGGSKNIFRGRVVDAGKGNAAWKKLVAAECLRQMNANGWEIIRKPKAILVNVLFLKARPKSHYRTGKYAGLLKASAPEDHTYTPDATKLWRSTEDAMTGIVWEDDAQITRQCVEKEWANLDEDFTEIHVRYKK